MKIRPVQRLCSGLIRSAVSRSDHSNSFGIDKPATELFKLLLGACVSTIKDKKTLKFVPDDVLWELPFQALKDSAGQHPDREPHRLLCAVTHRTP